MHGLNRREAVELITLLWLRPKAALCFRVLNRSYCVQQDFCQLNDKLSYALQALRSRCWAVIKDETHGRFSPFPHFSRREKRKSVSGDTVVDEARIPSNQKPAAHPEPSGSLTRAMIGHDNYKPAPFDKLRAGSERSRMGQPRRLSNESTGRLLKLTPSVSGLLPWASC